MNVSNIRMIDYVSNIHKHLKPCQDHVLKGKCHFDSCPQSIDNVSTRQVQIMNIDRPEIIYRPFELGAKWITCFEVSDYVQQTLINMQLFATGTMANTPKALAWQCIHYVPNSQTQDKAMGQA